MLAAEAFERNSAVEEADIRRALTSLTPQIAEHTGAQKTQNKNAEDRL